MRKIKLQTTKGTWLEFPEDPEVKLLIKPISVFALSILPSEKEMKPTDGWNMFNYMLLDWKGLVDENDKDIKCNEENKKVIFDYDQELVAFVLEKSSELREDVTGGQKELKNSKTSQPGEVTKQEK